MGRKLVLTTAIASVVAAAMLTTNTDSATSSAVVFADARPSCEHCMSTGSPYFCKASITSQICFNGGDAQCDHEFCVCCKTEPQGGCMACEELDEEEWQEENLEQIDAWQSHALRRRIEKEAEERTASRNEEIGLKTAALTKEKLAQKREEEAKKLEEEKQKYAHMKKPDAEENPIKAVDGEGNEIGTSGKTEEL